MTTMHDGYTIGDVLVLRTAVPQRRCRQLACYVDAAGVHMHLTPRLEADLAAQATLKLIGYRLLPARSGIEAQPRLNHGGWIRSPVNLPSASSIGALAWVYAQPLVDHTRRERYLKPLPDAGTKITKQPSDLRKLGGRCWVRTNVG
jgi:hypothetical protein